MLKIGAVYRMPNPHQESIPFVDGLPNYYYETRASRIGFAFQKGIHNVQQILCEDGSTRCPLIIISSTPRKAGSEDTPWHDRYDSSHGYVKYYGDNKPGKNRPENAPGNRILLDLLKYYDSSSEVDRQQKGVPVVFFEKCSYDGRAKGNAIFHGFGILESAELVTQYGSKHEYFANYLFNFCILSLADTNEEFDWRWIIDRCDSRKSAEETLEYAPASWKRWIKSGKDELHLIRRSVSGRGLIKEKDQRSNNNALLMEIYRYYNGRKHEFEALAMEVVIAIIEETGAKCTPGWITKKSGDGGVDFVLRVDIGVEPLAAVK